MFRNFFIFIIIISFCAFLFGIRHIFLEVEENACRMTYMFGIPQFSVRSLASVALRKAMDNERGIHLDYFTVNYEEQLSGLYGGYLENQKRFLQLSILAVQNLYKTSSNTEKNVIIIGHSMGGKVAEAVLEEYNIARYINTIIFISTPLDNPVVNFDTKINEFYRRSDRYLSSKRVSYLPNQKTNVCSNYQDRIPEQRNESTLLDNVLMLSIGGGNRDILVRDALTTSKYSDIHAMTSSIPRVWLSCDHLSAVWCLQLVMVINRFIFGITTIDQNKNVFYTNDKTKRTLTAINYFVKALNKHKSNEVYFQKSTDDATWYEDSKIVYRRLFKNGLRTVYNHLMPISKYKYYKKLFIEVDSFDETTEWIYGCSANLTNYNSVKCDKGTSLSHNIQSLSSHDDIRSVVLIDLQHIIKFYPQWTHILVRLQPTNKPITLKIDVYKNKERNFIVKAPRWFSFHRKNLINESVYGNIHYEILIQDLDEPFPTLQFNVEAIGCGDKEFNVVAKICTPWARGFERYRHITKTSKDKSIYVNVPFSSPNNYNTTENPVSLELFLDPVCRYKISYQYSIAGTMSKIVQEFYHWLPAHLIAVLFVVLRNQIVKFQTVENTLFIKPYAGFFQCKSLYILTGCRLLKKLLLPVKFLPLVEVSTSYSFYVSVIIHSTAIVASIILAFVIWTIFTFHGNLLHRIALRVTRISMASSNVLVQIISTLPLTFGVLFISIAFASCSGIALTLASIFYFIMLSNAYKDYLENWAWEKATGLFRKLRSRNNECNQLNSDERLVPAVDDIGQTYSSESEQSNEYFQGLENFSFHITMLLLLLIMSGLNFGLSIAWIKSHYYGHIGEKLPDPFLTSTIVALSSLSVLLQLNAPQKSSGYRFVAVVLYLCACSCIVYCQENVYRLNYLIAFVFAIVVLQEIMHRLLHYLGIQC